MPLFCFAFVKYVLRFGYISSGRVNSPAIGRFISFRISFGDMSCPSRNISLVSTHSTVESYPLMTPASSKCSPVSYRAISTMPVWHCEMFMITIPRWVASFSSWMNQGFCGALPEPYVFSTTAFRPGVPNTVRTMFS